MFRLWLASIIGLYSMSVHSYSVVEDETVTPICHDDKGVRVKFIPVSPVTLMMNGTSVAMAVKDKQGKPVVAYDSYWIATLVPQHRTFIFYHECAHHELGHTNLPKYYNSPNDIEKGENDADCFAAQKVKQSGFTQNDFNELIRSVKERDNTHQRVAEMLSCIKDAQ